MLSAAAGTGDIHVIAEGLGPEDGASGYKTYVGINRPSLVGAIMGNSCGGQLDLDGLGVHRSNLYTVGVRIKLDHRSTQSMRWNPHCSRQLVHADQQNKTVRVPQIGTFPSVPLS
jgi:hypothetical protein